MKKALLSLIIALCSGSLMAQWTNVNTGTTQNLYSVDYHSSSIIWIGSYNQVVTTSNGGSTWSLVGNPMVNTSSISINPAWIYGIKVTSATSALSTGEFYGSNELMVLSTTNSGVSWAEPYMSSGSAIIYMSALDLSGTNAIAVGTNGVVITSSNSGATWTFTPGLAAKTVNDVRFLTNDTVVAIDNGDIYRSFNAGATWSDSLISGSFSVVRTLKNIVYLAGTNGLVKSTNYGSSYTHIKLPFGLSGPIAVASKNVILAAGTGGVYISKTGGTYWEKCNLPKIGTINMISCLDSNHAIVVGNSGYAVMTTNLTTAPTTPVSAKFSINPSKSSYCLGDSVTLADSTINQPGYTYKWELNRSVFSTSYNTGVRLNTEGTDTIMLIVSNATGSDTTKSVVTVIGHHINPLVLKLLGNDTICPGNMTGFEVMNTQTGVNYQLRSGYTKIGSAVAGNGGIVVLPYSTALSAKKGFNIIAIRTTSCFTDSLIAYDTVYINSSAEPAAICTPASGTCSYVSIHNVKFGSINNTSYNTYLVNDYFDFACCQGNTLMMNGKYPFSITTKCSFSGTNTYVWIDYNGDGNFETNELAYSAYTDTTSSGTITIPTTTYFNKPVRMRVSTYEYTISGSACSASGCGQTEDFYAIIQPDTVKPIAKFTYTSTTTCNTVITFTDSTYNATSYAWNFGDGSTSAAYTPPAHTYAISGTYTVTLVATNPYGTDTMKRVLTISNPLVPIADSCVPTKDPYSCTPGTLTYVGLQSVWSNMGGGFANDLTCTMQTHLTVDSTYYLTLQGSGQTQAWIDYENTGNLNDPGDKLYTYGDVSGSPVYYLYFTVVHNAVCNKPLRLRVCSTSSTGYVNTACDVLCGNYVEMTVFIDPNPAINVGFTANKTTICLGDTVKFTNNSKYAKTYTWHFGDGNTSTILNPTHVYTSAGTYTVELRACTPYTCDSLIDSAYITVKTMPAVTLAFNNNVCAGSADTITATGGISYVWSTGSTDAAAIVNPTTTTTYSVAISNGGCVKDTTAKISVIAGLTVTITGDSVVCMGNSTTLTASGATTYTWSPGGSLSTTIGPTVTASPTSTTTYTITGTSGIGCNSSVTRTVTVFPSNGFDLTGALSVCIDTPTFKDASIQACIFNNRCTPTSGTMKLIVDTAIHITGIVSDSTTRMSGDTMYWNYDSLSVIGKTHCVSLSGKVDSLPAGDSVFVTMLITPVAGDSVPSNNNVTYWVKPFPHNCVGLPYDPNEKAVYPVGNIPVTQLLTYTIHFQNTGTGIAHNVVVIDTLSPYLDPTTLKEIAASSPVVVTIMSGNIVKFTFDGIDLPDTAMSKTTSIGVVQFTIKPVSSDANGDKIVNRAGIYFDANPVVKTNSTLNIITGVLTSVQNIEPLMSLACFPNPFTLTTSIVFNTDGEHYLEIDDIIGRKLESIKCTGKQYELNRNGLAAGVYFIKAFDADQKYIATTKVIVE